jgi:hypothetical protein
MRVTAWLVYTETSAQQKGLPAPVRADHAGEVVAVRARVQFRHKQHTNLLGYYWRHVRVNQHGAANATQDVVVAGFSDHGGEW